MPVFHAASTEKVSGHHGAVTNQVTLMTAGSGSSLRIVRNGVPFVTAPYPLLDPLGLATLNTGIPCVGPLPATLTLTL
eukprot:124003-Chlamydomonas_euryale.AAC.15